MIENILSFPEQLKFTPEVKGKPFEYEGDKVFVAGMGGSGAVGDFLLDWLKRDIVVVKGYNLPNFAKPEDLVILVSYSGDTEETLSVLEDALKLGCRCVSITSGGKLEDISLNKGFPVFKVPMGYQPREAYGYLLKACVYSLRLLGYIDEDTYKVFLEASESLNRHKDSLHGEDSPTYEIAAKIYRRIPIIYSQYVSIGIRWKNQINENANNFAHFSAFPEQNHNDIEGFDFPEFIKDKAYLIFLKTDYDHPRVKKRMEIVKDILKDDVVGVSEVEAEGNSEVEQMLYLIWFGDLVSYWLAIQNSTDPYRIDRIKTLKRRLQL